MAYKDPEKLRAYQARYQEKRRNDFAAQGLTWRGTPRRRAAPLNKRQRAEAASDRPASPGPSDAELDALALRWLEGVR